MAMVGAYRRVTEEELDRLLHDPESVGTFLQVDDEVIVGQDERFLDIDKAWQGIHFLLTRQSWGGVPPVANAVLGGTQLGTAKYGWGPVRYLTPKEVQDVAGALGRVDESALRSYYDSVQLEKAEIYPEIWSKEGPGALEYLLKYYRTLVRFFADASAANEGMLMWIE